MDLQSESDYTFAQDKFDGVMERGLLRLFVAVGLVMRFAFWLGGSDNGEQHKQPVSYLSALTIDECGVPPCINQPHTRCRATNFQDA